jgi:hypothetical protein
MTKLIKTIRETINHRIGHGLHSMETGVHAVYLGAAYTEGHGFHAVAALGLLVIVLLIAVAGEH